MTDFIPLFPLKMVVFPGEELNLHIFEARYKQLIRECEQNGVTFGIPSYINESVMDFGTEIKLLSVEKRYDNGELDIKTLAIGVFRIHEFYRTTPKKLYSGADIERLEISEEGDHYLANQIITHLNELFRILNIEKDIPRNKEDYSTYELAHHVGFSIEQEYDFLCLQNEMDRQQFMLDHLIQLIPVVKEMERLRIRVQMNGHFKNVIPPEV